MKSNAVTIKIDKYDGMLEPAAKAWYYERLAEAAYNLVTGKAAPMTDSVWAKDYEAVKAKLLKRGRITKCEF